MNINLTNYEAYFLDYHEGSLSPALVKELMDFVAQHPELKEEFENFEAVSLTDSENIAFDKKELLKKSTAGINESNFDEHAVQYMEGTLPVDLQNELKAFISKNPHYKKELELYTKTKLVPETIVFEDKFLLKKGSKRPAAYYYWSAAASVAIIIGAYFFLNRNVAPTPNGNTIVKQHQNTDSNTVAHHVSNKIDSTAALPKDGLNNPANGAVKNNNVAVNVTSEKQHRKVHAMPTSRKEEEHMVASGGNKIHALPIRAQNNIPVNLENTPAISFGNIEDTSIVVAWMKQYMPVNTNLVNYAAADDETKDSQGSKFLYLLAKYTCKGLHKITGQHIKFQKKYDSDTTNIIAYQLDLGNKKINFPVKE